MGASSPVASDTTVSMMVYWKIKDRAAFLKGCGGFVELTKKEEGVRYYGFTLSGDEAVCKEGYDSAVSFWAYADGAFVVPAKYAASSQVASDTTVSMMVY